MDRDELIQLLALSPRRIHALITGLPADLVDYKPELDHFSIKEIVGHLIHGEETDWIPRLKMMIKNEHDELPIFTPFDRLGQDKFIKNYDIHELVSLFSRWRQENLEVLRRMEFNPSVLKLEGIHPELGKVNAEWLLNTWICHDLSHINQINRIISTRYKNVGPWKEYIRILNNP